MTRIGRLLSGKLTGIPRRTRWAASLYVALAALAASSPSSSPHAATVEQVIKVPITLKTHWGDRRREVQQDIVVTMFRDDAREKSPYVVINHGRVSGESGRAKFGRMKYSDISGYLVSLGFVVLVPTRIGYGVTGGP